MTEEIARQAQLDQVEPGNTGGTRHPLAVLAHFVNQAPDHATLVIRDPQGTDALISLRTSTLSSAPRCIVDERFPIVEYDGEQSKTYQVNVFEFPTLMRRCLQTLSQVAGRTVEDTRRLSAVRHTTSYRFHLNKPVQCASRRP